MTWPFGDIPKGKAQALLVDPPWRFASNSQSRPGRNPLRHYSCLTIKELVELPVGDLAAPDSALFLWITGPLLAKGAHVQLMSAWGFKPSGMGFVWIKLNKKANPLFVMKNDLATGPGFTTRKNAEFCLIGRRGRSLRRSASVHEIIISARREHSRKPGEIHERIEKYTPGPYVELFARQSRSGWSTWGDQSRKFDE